MISSPIQKITVFGPGMLSEYDPVDALHSISIAHFTHCRIHRVDVARNIFFLFEYLQGKRAARIAHDQINCCYSSNMIQAVIIFNSFTV